MRNRTCRRGRIVVSKRRCCCHLSCSALAGRDGDVLAVGDRWPPQQANDASAKLTALANALGKNEAVDQFVTREIMRGEFSIGEPPAAADIAAVRELLLREPIVWERHDEIGDQDAIEMRAMQMTMARVLVASALKKARRNDRAAWDDLHAVWKLSRTLDGHPQMMMRTAAFSMARMSNAVAWKMPLPAPAWFAELQAHDNVRTLLAAFQYQNLRTTATRETLRTCSVESHASHFKNGPTLLPDATGLPRGVSRSPLQKWYDSAPRCHGLAPWHLPIRRASLSCSNNRDTPRGKPVASSNQ